MLVTIVVLGVVAAVAALASLDLGMDGGFLPAAVPGGGSIETARTMAFTTLVFAQICNALNARSDRVSAFVRPFENRVLWISIAVTVVLQVAVVHLGVLQSAFRTEALGWRGWLVSLALATAVLWADEIRKLVVRARPRQVRRTGPLPAGRQAR